MKLQRAVTVCPALVGAAVLLTLGGAKLAIAQPAIFTTDANGWIVDANIYASKADVYLNGGPTAKTCNLGGLADGTYYFQVTDPSGSVLLSTDPIGNRQFTVSGGAITAASTHWTGIHHCNALWRTVQLAPYSTTPNPGREYKAWVTPVSAWVEGTGFFGFNPASSKTDNFKVRSNGNGGGDEPDAVIQGSKYYDLNLNGSFDPGEATIAGFRIDVAICRPAPCELGPPTLTTFTGLDGEWALVLDQGTRFRACEVLPITGQWLQTGPIPGAANIGGGATADAARCWTGITGATDIVGLHFGNVCLGAGGGRTLGFWSNKNGQALFGSDDLALMVGLNLRSADGGHFDPASYGAFRNWLLDATAANMSYMLSAQLASMELNVLNGFASGGSWVLAGAKPGACSVPVNQAGFITVNALMGEANSELGLDGFTPAGDPERVCQEFKKNALDAANNNRSFVQPAPCTPVY